MDVDRFLLNACQKIAVFKYIYKHEKFFVADLEVKFKMPQSTVYRCLEEWHNKGLLEKSKNGEFIEYKTTCNWVKFYLGLREKILDILLYA